MRVNSIRPPFICKLAIARPSLGWGLLLLLSVNTLAAEVSKSGKILFQRCAVCHLPTAEGIPGAFPPLTDEQIADVLNYVARNLGKASSDWQPFSAAEVATTISQYPLSNGTKVSQLRHQLFPSGQP